MADGKYLLFTRKNDVYLLEVGRDTMVRLTANPGWSTDAVFWPTPRR